MAENAYFLLKSAIYDFVSSDFNKPYHFSQTQSEPDSADKFIFEFIKNLKWSKNSIWDFKIQENSWCIFIFIPHL